MALAEIFTTPALRAARRRPYLFVYGALVAACAWLMALALQAPSDPMSLAAFVLVGLIAVNLWGAVRRHRHRSLFSTLAQFNNDMTFVIAPTGLLTYVSPSVCHILGFAEHELVGQHALAFFHPNDRAAASAAFQRILPSPEATVLTDFRVRRKDGAYVDLESRGANLSHRREVGGVLYNSRDMTERNQARREMLLAKEDAERGARAKSEFLANMSHEIRTPLNAVIGMTSLLLEADPTPTQRDYIETIRSSGDGLLDIINNILDFSKLESQMMDLEAHPFDLRDCIEEALDLLATSASNKGIDLAYRMAPDVPGSVIGDVTRVRQVLVNLVANAIKFTERGEVVVSVNAADGVLSFSVQDTGIGIPRDRLDRLFKPFSQVDSSTARRFGGTGLGLAISKHLVQAMGGEISADSIEGVHTTFHFSIRAPASAEGERKVFLRAQHPLLAGLRAVVVDDTGANRTILAEQMRAWGMHVEVAETVPDALALLGPEHDLLLTDLQMPGQDGMALLSEVAKRADLVRVKRLLLSSLGRSPKASELQALGVQECLTKPIKQAVLHAALLRALGQETTMPRYQEAHVEHDLAEREPRRLLLAEDHAINQKVALKLLSTLGYRADLAANGQEVLDALRLRTYDIILMDVQMPVMDGLEATRRIVAEYGADRPRIVAMTANALQGDAEECRRAGMDDYIAKPVRLTDLQAVIKRQPVRAHSEGEINAVSLRQLETEAGADLVKELIGMYLKDAPARVAAMKLALASRDSKTLQREAHTLRSASATLGGQATAKACEVVEQRARDCAFEEAAAALPALEAMLSRFSPVLAQELGHG